MNVPLDNRSVHYERARARAAFSDRGRTAREEEKREEEEEEEERHPRRDFFNRSYAA